MAVVGYATIQLIPSLKGFASNTQNQMRPVVNSIGTDAGKKAGGLFGGSFVGSVGRIMAAAGIYEIGSRVASGISGAISAGIKGFADLQTYTISFKTLLGSASAANDMIRDLYSFAAKTPFDVEGSVVGAQKLLGVGVAAKDIIPTLTTLGDSTAALGGSTADFNSVLLAYSQIMARGKVSTQDLYQISNTGIPIFQLLSKALGMPVGELQKLIEQGKLASDDVLPKLLKVMNENYGGAMTGQAETLTGLWSTFKDTMSQVLTQALTPVGEWLSTILPGATTAATNAIQFITDKLTGVSDWVAQHKDEITSAFAPFAAALQSTDWEGLLGTIGTGLAAVAEDSLPVIKSLGTIASEILPPLVDLINTLGDGLGKINDLMTGNKDSTDSANDSTRSFTDTLYQAASPMLTLIDALNLFGKYVAPVVGGALQVADAFAQGKSATDVLADALNGKFGLAMQLGGVAVYSFQAATVRATTTMLSAFLSFTTNTVGRLGAWAAATAVMIRNAMAQGAIAIGVGVTGWITGLATGLGRFVTTITTGMAGGVSAIGRAMTSMYLTITGWLGNFVSAGASLIGGFVDGIVSGIERARTAASQVVSAVANFFPHSPAPEGPFSGRGWTLYSGRSLVDGFAKGVQQRQAGLRSLMNETFTAPTAGPGSSVVGEVSAATTSRAGAYIGSATINTTNGNAGVINDLNFYLRNLSRGGR